MAEPITGYGEEAGICGHDGTNWIKLLSDALGHLQVDVVDSGGSDLGDVITALGNLLTELQAKLETTDLNIEATSKDLQVDVKTSGLPTGAATSANQTTMITALQLIDDLRTALTSVATDSLDVRLDGQTADVEVTQTTPADLCVAQHQYDGAAWRKSNLLWGYNGVFAEAKSVIDSAAGDINMAFTAVPSGYVYVLLGVYAKNENRAATYLRFNVNVGGVGVVLRDTPQTAAAHYDVFVTETPMIADDLVWITFFGTQLNDDLYGGIWGYKMKINM